MARKKAKDEDGGDHRHYEPDEDEGALPDNDVKRLFGKRHHAALSTRIGPTQNYRVVKTIESLVAAGTRVVKLV